MTPAEVDEWLEAYQAAQADRAAATKRMSDLAEKLQVGSVNVGTTLRVHRSNACLRSRFDAALLRMHVPVATLNMCRTRSQAKPKITIGNALSKRTK